MKTFFKISSIASLIILLLLGVYVLWIQNFSGTTFEQLHVNFNLKFFLESLDDKFNGFNHIKENITTIVSKFDYYIINQTFDFTFVADLLGFIGNLLLFPVWIIYDLVSLITSLINNLYSALIPSVKDMFFNWHWDNGVWVMY